MQSQGPRAIPSALRLSITEFQNELLFCLLPAEAEKLRYLTCM